MSKFVGTWLVSGSATDPVTNLALDVTDDAGVAWPAAVASGYTVAIEIHKAGEADVFSTLAGDWEDVGDLLNPRTLYPIASSAALLPSTIGDAIEYECWIVLTKVSNIVRLGADTAGTPWGFTVKRIA